MKQDKYLRARGGTSKMLEISCASCGRKLFEYQKDGIGYIHRCYLNRIVSPKKWADLKFSQSGKIADLPNLTCECGNIIGSHMKHSDGRLAYRMERGKFKQKRI